MKSRQQRHDLLFLGRAFSGMEMDMRQKPDRTAASNPIYRITNRETTMAYFRASALTRLTAADVC